jgi:hypothetical protein
MITCDYCDRDGIYSVGNMRLFKCRTPRECSACGDSIQIGDDMYRQNMYDFDNSKIVAPIFLCNECGEMTENLSEAGFCFDFNSRILDQWLEYLQKTDPRNPALKYHGWEVSGVEATL